MSNLSPTGMPEYVGPEQSDELVSSEQAILKAALGKQFSGAWTGIALSGGGVRSATFCLGALQALAAFGTLKNFDYMSTVSGGGYIGVALQWLCRKSPELRGIANNRQNLDAETFPFGTIHPDPAESIGSATIEQARMLQFLRDNINYLAPGRDITFESIILAVIRTVFLNLVVWLPILVITLLLLLALSFMANDYVDALKSLITYIPLVAVPDGEGKREYYGFPIFFAIPFIIVCMYIFAIIIYSFATSLVKSERSSMLRYFFYAGPLLIGVPSLLFGLYLILVEDLIFLQDAVLGLSMSLAGVIFLVYSLPLFGNFRSHLQQSYWYRRVFDVNFAKLLIPMSIFAIISILPLANTWIYQWFQQQIAATGYGLVGIFLGILTSLYGHYTSLKSISPGAAGKVAMNLGAIMFLVGFAVLCFSIADYILSLYFDPPDNKEEVNSAIWTVAFVIFLSMTAVISFVFTNTNQLGLHRYYRDRLMETFMPSPESVAKDILSSSPEADKFEVADLVGYFSGDKLGCRPYPIINANAILINDKIRKVNVRGGASFAITPFYSGSDATGWIRTARYAEGQGPIYTASAMAVSGAAANSNAGYGGVGITRNRLVSLVMMLLNVRLGLWLTNPKTLHRDLFAPDGTRKRKALFVSRRPRHWHPGLTYCVFGWGYDRDSDFVELSDGGHFENLGVYELVRRGASVILVCDGEADKEISYAGLISAARRIHEDFGATIRFLDDAGPERLVPREPLGFPSNTMAAAAPYLVGQIRYRNGRKGVIVYVKATMIAELSFVAKGYRGKNPKFPHQSTVDQFFQTEQFEAYRELGYRSALRCAKELALDGGLHAGRIWSAYLKLNRQRDKSQAPITKRKKSKKSQKITAATPGR